MNKLDTLLKLYKMSGYKFLESIICKLTYTPYDLYTKDFLLDFQLGNINKSDLLFVFKEYRKA